MKTKDRVAGRRGRRRAWLVDRAPGRAARRRAPARRRSGSRTAELPVTRVDIGARGHVARATSRSCGSGSTTSA